MHFYIMHFENNSAVKHLLCHYLSETCIVGLITVLLFVLFLPMTIANTIDKTDNIVAVRNIRLYAIGLGKAPAAAVVLPLIFSICCWDCINIPAIAGPIAFPIILIKLVIPVEIPIDFAGVASIIIFMTPTAANDNPMLTIAKSIDTNN